MADDGVSGTAEAQEFPRSSETNRSQPSAHEAGEGEVAPQERQVSNLRQSEASSTSAACVLASAPGDHIGRVVVGAPPSVMSAAFLWTNERAEKCRGRPFTHRDLEEAFEAGARGVAVPAKLGKPYLDGLIDRLLMQPACMTERDLRKLMGEAAEMIHMLGARGVQGTAGGQQP